MKQKILVYRIGYQGGFFYEYRQMIAAYVYCKLNNIKFKLYSVNANFAIEKGWTDFFEPFCEEATEEIHSLYNIHFKYPSITKLLLKKVIKGITIPHWCWNKLSLWYLKLIVTAPYFKWKYHFNYYTHDLWSEVHKLNQHNTTQYNTIQYNTILNTWRFNEKTENEIEKISGELNLPEKWIGLHIRRGDKITEQPHIKIEEYIEMLKNKSNNLNLFVLTDDYSIIDGIQMQYPEYHIYTLCKTSERGYNNSEFMNASIEKKRSGLIKLFASVEILRKSEAFIGTASTGPSDFLIMLQHPIALLAGTETAASYLRKRN